jgi:hypothetical protein
MGIAGCSLGPTAQNGWGSSPGVPHRDRQQHHGADHGATRRCPSRLRPGARLLSIWSQTPPLPGQLSHLTLLSHGKGVWICCLVASSGNFGEKLPLLARPHAATVLPQTSPTVTPGNWPADEPARRAHAPARPPRRLPAVHHSRHGRGRTECHLVPDHGTHKTER